MANWDRFGVKGLLLKKALLKNKTHITSPMHIHQNSSSSEFKSCVGADKGIPGAQYSGICVRCITDSQCDYSKISFLFWGPVLLS